MIRTSTSHELLLEELQHSYEHLVLGRSILDELNDLSARTGIADFHGLATCLSMGATIPEALRLTAGNIRLDHRYQFVLELVKFSVNCLVLIAALCTLSAMMLIKNYYP